MNELRIVRVVEMLVEERMGGDEQKRDKKTSG